MKKAAFRSLAVLLAAGLLSLAMVWIVQDTTVVRGANLAAEAVALDQVTGQGAPAVASPRAYLFPGGSGFYGGYRFVAGLGGIFRIVVFFTAITMAVTVIRKGLGLIGRWRKQ